MLDVDGATRFATRQLAAVADPSAAAAMAAYMKTEMPFHGVNRPGLRPILRDLKLRWQPETRSEYRALVERLWSLPHREEKYLAIGVARAHDHFVTRTALPLYKRLIREGAWWDFVDEVAIKLVGRVLRRQREATTPTMYSWLGHSDLWVRRSAIISQVDHKEETDPDLLFTACTARAHETDFFIRKAIGWALREYAKTDPDAVRRYVQTHHDALSGLSRREATKHL
jgi:3-methyladenine DNA glycosylase AlkD